MDQKVAASTQNQALSALLFLYRDVLRQELENSIDAVRARQPKHLPTVLTREDVRTTMIYTHVLNRGGAAVRSPLDVD